MRTDGSERFGILRPAVDAHSLGVEAMSALLRDCGVRVVIADDAVRRAAERPESGDNPGIIAAWARGNGLTSLGFSYRLDPATGASLFSGCVAVLSRAGVLADRGGSLRSLYFAGLPDACAMARDLVPTLAHAFSGDESPSETLEAFGIPPRLSGASSFSGVAYDEDRMSFARELIASGDHLAVAPVDRSSSPMFGLRGDSLRNRVAHGTARALPPLLRAHVGPWLPDRKEAISLYLDWCRALARGGMIDVLSIGTSQLSQSRFGDDWNGLGDGGGVPVNSPAEFAEIWKAARPMLVRSYSGSRRIAEMATMLEDAIDIAWHALSLWWFSDLDGRGANGVAENIAEHLDALSVVARSGKPYEPNVPHHFAFRGCDDVTYVVSGYLAARAAKERGVGHLVLQTMLNTPKYAWGTMDLAKARALLHVVRELEDASFRVYLQPRGGLDYFSADPGKAKVQLAAVTAMMDDIEADDPRSPEIIHVVGYSEGRSLADPAVVDESARITRLALSRYRALKAKGDFPSMARHPEVLARASSLIADARKVISCIESVWRDPYGVEGLHGAFESGFLPVPWLDRLRDRYPEATRWNTGFRDGCVSVMDAEGRAVSVEERIGIAREFALSARKGGNHG